MFYPLWYFSCRWSHLNKRFCYATLKLSGNGHETHCIVTLNTIWSVQWCKLHDLYARKKLVASFHSSLTTQLFNLILKKNTISKENHVLKKIHSSFFKIRLNNMSDVLLGGATVRIVQMWPELIARVHQTSWMKGYCHLNGDSCTVYQKTHFVFPGFLEFNLKNTQVWGKSKQNLKQPEEKATKVMWVFFHMRSTYLSLISAHCHIHHFPISPIPFD